MNTIYELRVQDDFRKDVTKFVETDAVEAMSKIVKRRWVPGADARIVRIVDGFESTVMRFDWNEERFMR